MIFYLSDLQDIVAIIGNRENLEQRIEYRNFARPV